MRDHETISGLDALRRTFARAADKKPSYPDGLVKRFDDAGMAARLEAAGKALEQNDLKQGIQLMREGHGILYYYEQHINAALRNLAYSDEKRALQTEGQNTKDLANRLKTYIERVEQEERRQAIEQAAKDPAMLVRAAEILKSDYSAGDYTNISNIKELLLLAAQNQLRQEQAMKEMAEKIARLEKKAAEEETSRTLDKPQLTRPKTNGTPAP